jgi:hypothetical protein
VSIQYLPMPNRTNVRISYLATFGAFITVAALAVDPFSQQILQTYSCSVVVPDLTASIPRGNNFTADHTTTTSGSYIPVLDSQMAGAIFLGALSPTRNISSQVTAQCPSGNCTFSTSAGATYETIAMCSSCEDISSSIVDLQLQNPNGTKYRELPESSRGANDTLTISTAYKLLTRVVEATENFTFESLMLTLDPACANLTLGDQSCNRRGGAFATRCSLIPCVQSYTATITNFTLEEELVSSTNMVYDRGSYWMHGSYSLVTNSTIRNGVRHDCITTSHATAENTIPLTWNNTLTSGILWNAGSRKKSHWTSPHCVFHFDVSSLAVTAYLANMYNKQSLWRGEGDLWIKNLYNRGYADLESANKYMNGLAMSMTMHMRKSQNATKDPALGTVHAQKTCVRINWAWISLPASLVLMAIMFLAVTMWSSLTQSWHGTWKSSSLALVLASVESETLLQAGILDKKSKMSSTAKSIEVQFMKTERGWGFVEH